MKDERSESKKEQVIAYFSDASLPDFGVDSRFFPAMGKRLVELSGISHGMRVLDVAAGRGASLFPAAEGVGESGKVFGIDLAEGMVQETGKEISRRGISNASIHLMDAEKLEFETAYFDRVLCGFALFFLPHLEKALHEFDRVLKPGGIVAASTFGKSDEAFAWYEELLRKYGISREVPVIRSLEDPGVLRREFFDAGYLNIEIIEEWFESQYQNVDEWWSYLMTTADRVALELLSENDRILLQDEAFAKIMAFQSEGKIRVPYQVLFTLAAKG